MYCNDWLDTRVVLKYWILFPIFYGNHFQKIRTDLLLRIDTQSTCLFPQYDSWQRKRRLESPLLRAARAFFSPWNNDGKLALFFTLFQIGTTPVCPRFAFFCRRKIGVCRSEPHNGLQNTGRSTCSDQVQWRGRPQPQSSSEERVLRRTDGRWGTRIG